MFEKKKEFSWKVPTLVLLGVIVLACGVGIGIQVRETQQAKTITPDPKSTRLNSSHCSISRMPSSA